MPLLTTRRRIVSYAISAIVLLVPVSAVNAQSTPPDSIPPGSVPTEPAPALDDNDEVIHSWALAPVASDGGASRSELSYTADPGTVVDDAVTLFNFSNVELIFRVYASDAINNDDGRLDILSGDQAPTGVGSWVTIPQEFIQVAPGQQVTMPITITIPDGASAGDHLGAVVAASGGISSDGAGGVISMDRRTGTRLLVRVNGPVRTELSIEGLSTDYSPAANPLGGTATVSYRVTNTGNVLLGGSSSASVAGPFGIGRQNGGTVEVPELVPGQDVVMTADFSDVPAFGVLVTEVEVQPTDGATAGSAASATVTTRTFAPPIAVVLVLLAALLGLLVWRAYRRHQIADTIAEPVAPTEREPQHT